MKNVTHKASAICMTSSRRWLGSSKSLSARQCWLRNGNQRTLQHFWWVSRLCFVRRLTWHNSHWEVEIGQHGKRAPDLMSSITLNTFIAWRSSTTQLLSHCEVWRERAADASLKESQPVFLMFAQKKQILYQIEVTCPLARPWSLRQQLSAFPGVNVDLPAADQPSLVNTRRQAAEQTNRRTVDAADVTPTIAAFCSFRKTRTNSLLQRRSFKEILVSHRTFKLPPPSPEKNTQKQTKHKITLRHARQQKRDRPHLFDPDGGEDWGGGDEVMEQALLSGRPGKWPWKRKN